jgi:hypothetical protein
MLWLTVLTLLPSVLQAHEAALLHSPAADEAGGSLAEQFRLLHWTAAVSGSDS